MATPSVIETQVPPGLNDLLPSLLVRPNDPERIARAASNIHLPVVKGIAAIGGLLSDAAEMDPDVGTISKEDLYNLGFLLKHLGETADLAQHVYAGAMCWVQEDLRARAENPAKEG